MNTTEASEKEMIHIQERGAQSIEDKGRTADQILEEQMEQDARPNLFIP